MYRLSNLNEHVKGGVSKLNQIDERRKLTKLNLKEIKATFHQNQEITDLQHKFREIYADKHFFQPMTQTYEI